MSMKLKTVYNRIKEHRAAYPRRAEGESMSQDDLVQKVNNLGVDLNRASLSRIENQDIKYIDVRLQVALKIVLRLDTLDDLWDYDLMEDEDEGNKAASQHRTEALEQRLTA